MTKSSGPRIIPGKLLSNRKAGLAMDMDEINIATHLKLLTPTQVISVLKKASPTLHIILTGRNAPQSFLDLADLVTEMKECKHPFQKGTKK